MRLLHTGNGARGRALLADTPHPTGGDVREAISGNICRCRYVQIVDAVMLAADHLANRNYKASQAKILTDAGLSKKWLQKNTVHLSTAPQQRIGALLLAVVTLLQT